MINNQAGGIALPPAHPGRTLAAELAARGMTASALALKPRMLANRFLPTKLS